MPFLLDETIPQVALSQPYPMPPKGATLQHNRKITISIGESRKSINWQPQILWLTEFYQRLQNPVRGTETYQAYMRLPKAVKDAKKDVGGFVGGTLRGVRRKANAVTGRDLLTLDLDNLPPGSTDIVLQRLGGLECGYCVYSTRKHAPENPRLRAIIPLDRTANPDEYEPLARKFAELLQPEMSWFDPTTFEIHRLMYFPSVCSDSEFVYHFVDKPFLSVDGTLALYANWRDISGWPQVPGVTPVARLVEKQADPRQKAGLVGAFCNIYDIYAAIDKFLPTQYEKCDTAENRYTFTGGSTTGGAVIYEDGKFLYSHHATDPCSGKLVNAFDLVRLHLFGSLDEEAKPDTPVTKLPSWKEMCQFAAADEAVSNFLTQQQYQQAIEDFEVLSGNSEVNTGDSCTSLNETAIDGLAKRDKNPQTGRFEHTIKNAEIQMTYDPQLAGRICFDSFSDRYVGIAPLPWEPRRQESGLFEWTDSDEAGLFGYLERQLGFRSKDAISPAFRQIAMANRFNPVTDYMDGLSWDGKERLDTLFIDYLGAEDCPYSRAAARIMFVAAVARAHAPGTKYDYTAVLYSQQQGVGKSTLLYKMSNGWFTDSIKTFENKDAAELLEGCLIVEFGEMEAFSRSDFAAARSFSTRLVDHYRAAFGHFANKHPRRCVFFGTTNDHSFLKDPTGNRRYLPIDCMAQPRKKDVMIDLKQEEIDQIWAEAVIRWKLGEPLTLSDEMEAEAERRRNLHYEEDPWLGVVIEFLNKPIPKNWLSMDEQARSIFWSNPEGFDGEIVERDRVCALEIWKECLHQNRVPLSQRDARRINQILGYLPGWEPKCIRCGGIYGRQRGFVKIGKTESQ